MRNLKDKLLTVLMLVLIALQYGCASGGNQRGDYDPNKRLEHVLSTYGVVSEGDIRCELYRDTVLDCVALANDLEALYMEFPQSPRILLAGAVVEYQLGRRVQSQQILDELLAIPGAHPRAAVLRSRLAMADGNLTLARRLIESQIRLVPDYAGLHEAQAAVYFFEGRYKNALIALQSADRLGAPGWRTNYHLGLLFEAQDDWAKACNYFTAAMDDGPGHQLAMARILQLDESLDCGAALLTRR